MKLSELKTGEKGVIIKVLGHGGFRRRIIEMGFIKGKTVEVVLNAPLKDPIKYKIMGYEVSLRRQEADMIEIVSEEEARRTAATDTYHEPISQGIPVSDEVMKTLLKENDVPSMWHWWEIRTAGKPHFSTSLQVDTNTWATTAV